MTAFLNFHALAAARGEGLHPKLRLLFERAAASPASDVATRTSGLLQSGPDPASETAPDRVNVSVFPQSRAPHGRAEPESRNTGLTSCCLGEMTP
jgi:hypothetical protein